MTTDKIKLQVKHQGEIYDLYYKTDAENVIVDETTKETLQDRLESISSDIGGDGITIEKNADNKLQVKDASISTAKLVDGSVTIDKLAESNISTVIAASAVDTKLTTEKAVRDELDKLVCTLTRETTADEGYASTYTLKQGTSELGKIEIPKDYLVKSGEIKICETADTPVTGYTVGDKYLDFVVNSKDATDTEQHIYILLKELVDAYTGEGAINVSTDNVISVKVDDTTVEISDNKLQVKDNSIVTAKIADDAVTKDKIDETAKVVYEEDTQTLANKVIDAAANTITNIGLDELEPQNTADAGKSFVIQADGTWGLVEASSNPDETTIETNSSKQLQIKDAGVTEDKIADDAVVTVKIKDKAVTKGKIDESAKVVFEEDAQTLTNKTIDADSNTVTNIGLDELEPQNAADVGKSFVIKADGTWEIAETTANSDDVTIEKNADRKLQVKDLGITEAKLTDSAVTETKLADDAVATAKVKDGAITTAKITDDAVTIEKIADGNVSTVIADKDTAVDTKLTTEKAVRTELDKLGCSLIKETTADDGYAATYTFKQGDAVIGKVEIPKDFLVKSGSVKTCEAIDTPVLGYAVGDKYLDFVVNSINNTATDEHIYILVKDLVDTYTSSGAIEIDSANVISVKVDDTTIEVADSKLQVKDSGIATAKIADEAITKTKIDEDAKVVFEEDTQTLTNKSIDADNNTVTNIGLDELKPLTSSDAGKSFVVQADGTWGYAEASSNPDEVTIETNSATQLQIKDGGVTTEKVADNAITTAKVVDANITTDKLADVSVTTVKLADNSVTTVKVADANITTNKLADSSVTTEKVADDAVTIEKIADTNISTTVAAADIAVDTKLTTEKAVRTELDKLECTLTKETTADEGYAATYTFKQGTTELGKVEIPKDFLVKSGTVNTCTTADDPVAGYVVGDKYLDFVVNTKDASGTDEHIYILIKDLVDVYTGTGAVDISDANVVSVKVDDNTVEIADNKLQVKDNAITTAKIVDDAVTKTKIADDAKVVYEEDTQTLTNKTIDAVSNTITNIGADELEKQATTEAGKSFVVQADGTWALSDAQTNPDNTTIETNTAKQLQIKDLGVVEGKIADGAVTTVKVADDAITTSKVVDANITTAKLADNAVTTVKIADANVTTVKIADANVTTDKLADTSVTTAKIVDDAVTIEKVADANISTVIADKDAAVDTKLTTEKAVRTELDKLTVTVTKETTADEGYAATYTLKQDTTELGKIEIPKDFLVKSGDVKTCTVADTPVTGYAVGDKYLDFVVNSKDAMATDEHIYILIKDLVDAYTGTGAIAISDANVISVKVDDSTVEITDDKLQVKDGGIVDGKLATDAVTTVKIKDEAVTKAKIATDAKVVYEADTQTLTNKTIDADSNTIQNIDADEFKAQTAADAGKAFVVQDDGSWALAEATAKVDDVTVEKNTSKQLQVKDAGISEAKLATDAVTTDKVKDANITTAKLVDDAVTTVKIVDDAVTKDKIADDAKVVYEEDTQTLTNKSIDATANTITNIGVDELEKQAATDEGKTFVVKADGTWEIAKVSATPDDVTIEENASGQLQVKDSGIAEAKLADDAVVTAKIKDANVTTDKIADDAVTIDKVADTNISTTIANKDSAVDTKLTTEKAVRTELDKLTVTLAKETTADEGYIATYTLKQDTTELGKINIPKDFLVKSGSVKTCDTVDTPVSGYAVGDKYLDFVVNVKEGSADDEHIYILIKDLVDSTYTGEGAINISDSNVITVLNDNKTILADEDTKELYTAVGGYRTTKEEEVTLYTGALTSTGTNTYGANLTTEYTKLDDLEMGSAVTFHIEIKLNGETNTMSIIANGMTDTDSSGNKHLFIGDAASPYTSGGTMYVYLYKDKLSVRFSPSATVNANDVYTFSAVQTVDAVSYIKSEFIEVDETTIYRDGNVLKAQITDAVKTVNELEPDTDGNVEIPKTTEAEVVSLFDSNYGTVNITQKPHETITVTCNGNSYTATFKELLGYPWFASVVAESNYIAGALSATNGKVITSVEVTVDDATNIEYGSTKVTYLDGTVEYISINGALTSSSIGNDSKVRTVEIGSTVSSIGNYGLSNKANMTSVTIPSTVASIGDHAFDSCNGLKSITIPEGVTSIGNSAFTACSQLATLIMEATTPPTLGTNVFEGTVMAEIRVPSASLSAYQTTWSTYASMMVGY